MPWLKLDDVMGDHRKVRRATRKAGVGAFGLHVLGLLHCARYLTDGFLEHDALDDIAEVHNITDEDREEQVQALTQAKLWHEVEGGWEIHDYLDHNHSRSKIEERRAADRDRKRTGPVGSSSGSSKGFRSDSERNPVGVPPESEPPRARARPRTQDGTGRDGQTVPPDLLTTFGDRPPAGGLIEPPVPTGNRKRDLAVYETQLAEFHQRLTAQALRSQDRAGLLVPKLIAVEHFDIWLAPCQLVAVDGRCLHLAAPQSHYGWVRDRFDGLILKAAQSLGWLTDELAVHNLTIPHIKTFGQLVAVEAAA